MNVRREYRHQSDVGHSHHPDEAEQQQKIAYRRGRGDITKTCRKRVGKRNVFGGDVSAGRSMA
jgi:hypothetical protein